MGLFGFMRRRRERESAALAVAAQWAQVAESAQAAGHPPRATPDDDPNDDLAPSEPVVIPALPGMPGGLAGMLAQAMGAEAAQTHLEQLSAN